MLGNISPFSHLVIVESLTFKILPRAVVDRLFSFLNSFNLSQKIFIFNLHNNFKRKRRKCLDFSVNAEYNINMRIRRKKRRIMKKIINVHRISKFIKYNKLTKIEFCKMCGIHISTLNKILQDRPKIRITALFKIARVMDLHICNLLY